MIVKQVEKASQASGCCGGPAVLAGACCVADEQAKASGQDGCGCSTQSEAKEKEKTSCC